MIPSYVALLYVVILCSVNVLGFNMPSRASLRRMSWTLYSEEVGNEASSVVADPKDDPIRVAKEGILRLAGGQASEYTVKQIDLLELQGYIRCLEESTEKINDLEGECELLYTNDDPTRSSPFFSAFRKNVKGIKTPFDPLNNFPEDFGEAIFKITDNIPIKKIGSVKQYISNGEIKSEVRVMVNPVGSSLMVTTSAVSPLEENEQNRVYDVRVIKSEVLDSTVAKYIPWLDPASNPNGFPSGAALELTNPGSSSFQIKMSFNDGHMRVVRSLEDPDSVFLYKKV